MKSHRKVLTNSIYGMQPWVTAPKQKLGYRKLLEVILRDAYGRKVGERVPFLCPLTVRRYNYREGVWDPSPDER